MALSKYLIPVLFVALSLVSCNNETTLQEYLVEKQSDNNFVKMDLATSMLLNENVALSDNQRNILETVKKVNVVAFTKKEGNEAALETERARVTSILTNEKYEDLGTFKTNGMNIKLSYVGQNEEYINEFILYGSKKGEGFALARLLGEDMNPSDLFNLLTSIDEKDINNSSILDVTKLLGL